MRKISGVAFRSSLLLWGAAATLFTATADAQTYPSRPVKILTTAAGSSSDLMSRLIAKSIEGPLGQPVVVENQGSGVIPVLNVANAKPDGLIILLQGNSMWVRPLLESVTYDTLRDFEPVIQVSSEPGFMTVSATSPVNSVKDFLALANSQPPGKLFYATGSTGNLTHMAAELFQAMSGTKLTRVSYKSGAAGRNDLVAGRVQAMFGLITLLGPSVKAGKLKALGVTSQKRSHIAPDVPPIADALPGYDYSGGGGIFAPAKTPRPIVDRLNGEINKALSQMETQFNGLGVEAVGGTPEAFSRAIRNEVALVSKLIKDRGIQRGADEGE